MSMRMCSQPIKLIKELFCSPLSPSLIGRLLMKHKKCPICHRSLDKLSRIRDRVLTFLLEFVVNCGNPLLHNQNSLPPHPTTPPTHSFTGSRVHSLRFFVNQWIILHAKSVKNIRPTVRAIVLQSVVFCCCRFGTNLLPAWPRNASVTLNYSRLQF